MKRLILLGAGKYGREMEDIARQTGRFSQVLFLDDGAEGPHILGKCADFPAFQNPDTQFLVAFGNNEVREKWCEALMQAGADLTSVIHPTAYVSPTAILGRGVAVLPQTIVNSYTTIGDGCIINSGAIVDHDCELSPYVHICVGAIVKADNRIPAKLKVEAGVVIQRETYKGEQE